MRAVISELPLPQSLDRILALHNANRTNPASAARFRWAYLDNPHGPARAWGAEDGGSLIGVASVFPRRVRLATGPLVRAWTAGDLSVATSHRRRGLASALRACASAAVDRGEADLLFAIPNAEATVVHERVGFRHIGRMQRLVRVLALPGPRWFMAVTRWPLAQAVRSKPGRQLASAEVTAITGQGLLEEAAALYERVAPAIGTSVERSAAYLRWRFLDNQKVPTRLLVIRDEGQLRGYAAIVDRGFSLYLRDWLADGPEAARGLVDVLVALAHHEGKAWLSVSALHAHQDLPMFRECGFRDRREATAVTVYVPANSPYRDVATDPSRWFLTGGDPDV